MLTKLLTLGDGADGWVPPGEHLMLAAGMAGCWANFNVSNIRRSELSTTSDSSDFSEFDSVKQTFALRMQKPCRHPKYSTS